MKDINKFYVDVLKEHYFDFEGKRTVLEVPVGRIIMEGAVENEVSGVIGEEDLVRNAPLRAIAGGEEVVPVLKPYKLASREFQPADSVVEVGYGVQLGGGALGMIAGPCAIESEEVLLEIGRSVKQAGANILRGGAFNNNDNNLRIFHGLHGFSFVGILIEARSIAEWIVDVCLVLALDAAHWIRCTTR